jgi:HEAT repeat protein
MRKRASVVTLLVCGLAAALVATLLLNRDDTPRYQELSLTEWYHIWRRAEGGFHDSRYSKADAVEAIRQIGTNALPALLKQTRRQPYTQFSVAQMLIYTLPTDLVRTRTAQSLALSTDPINPVAIFRILGSEARPAIPELTNLLLSATNRASVKLPASCLAAIGEEGVAPLVAALADPQLPCCQEAAFYFRVHEDWYRGTNLAIAVPVLANLVTNADPDLAYTSILALGSIKLEPQISVPALAQALRHRDRSVRTTALGALAQFGKPARPVLTNALMDPDIQIRIAATNLMLLLDPGSHTNGVFIFQN